MRTFSIVATLTALVTPLALHAAEPAKNSKETAKAPAPAAQASLTPEQQKTNIERGVRILSLFNGALQNKEVPEDQKSYLFSCLYNNKLENISVATGELFAKNPKLDSKDPKTLYQAAATICGVNKAPSFAKVERPAGTPAPAPVKGR